MPATGGMQQHAPHFQVNEFVRVAAGHMGGTPHFIHAPYLPSAETRAAFLADPSIADSVALWDRIDAAIVGVGLPHAVNAPEASAATPSEQSLSNAVGDVIRHYFDRDGKLIQWEGESRMIAASPAQLRAAPWSSAWPPARIKSAPSSAPPKPALSPRWSRMPARLKQSSIRWARFRFGQCPQSVPSTR